ncbi:hypothetical protein LIPSTDRAFT_317631 [Lipomyces starkeyi NRRL Y-11557]|uniref:Uncharacterized protein n=1 Tax=Lipomyces starkeyi NRRL Y-11557 TaxID=675824 RepID=A0A1E3Q3D4_LIPST|nr:hypothetical protein LIPSTDRAFT_317631 [Lipomyces starkeyi NRRL Y-11557]
MLPFSTSKDFVLPEFVQLESSAAESTSPSRTRSLRHSGRMLKRKAERDWDYNTHLSPDSEEKGRGGECDHPKMLQGNKRRRVESSSVLETDCMSVRYNNGEKTVAHGISQTFARQQQQQQEDDNDDEAILLKKLNLNEPKKCHSRRVSCATQ